jgi:hypothetical protein
LTRALLLFFLTSCVAGLNLRRGAALDQPEIASFLAKVAAAEAGRTSLSGGGTLTFRRATVPLKAMLSMSAGIDGRVRIDVSTDAGNVVLAFAANPETVQVIDFEHRQFMSGPTGANDLAPLGVPEIDARSLARLLLSRLPCTGRPSGADATHIEYTDCLGGTLIATFAASAEGAPLLRSFAVQKGAETAISARLLAHNAQGFARRVEIETKATTLVVQLDEIEPNSQLDEDIFTLAPPPGIAPH